MVPKKPRPQITKIRPAVVSLGWEGAVQIVGDNFANDSSALFNGRGPKSHLQERQRA